MKGTKIYKVAFDREGRILEGVEVKGDELKAVSEIFKRKHWNIINVEENGKMIKTKYDITEDFRKGIIYATSRAINIIIKDMEERETARAQRLQLLKALEEADLIIFKKPRKREWVEIFTIKNNILTRELPYSEYIRNLYEDPYPVYRVVTNYDDEKTKQLLKKTIII